MKVSRIEIKDFNQFKDFTLDLTYPKGHAKEGKPLDKVCIIGQSGTGKTTLLELIPKFTHNYDTHLITKLGENAIYDKIVMGMSFGTDKKYNEPIIVSEDKLNISSINYSSNWYFARFRSLNYLPPTELIKLYNDWRLKKATPVVIFPANLNYDIEVDTDDIVEDRKIIDFNKDNIKLVWNLVLDKVKKYQEEEIRRREQLSKTVQQSTSDLDAIKMAVREFEEWKNTEFNPVADIADNCLDRLLEPIKVRVKREMDFKTKGDIGFIKVEDFEGTEIPYGLWSTGTKQVVLSAMPMYLLKPKHTIILFDEPERSLYPDIQRRIIDFYSSLTEDCQFFYATHSPIIASCFEPWEIVELKLNAERKVYRERYYEGGNHVDNYKWNPKYMRWDDILVRVFEMETDGGPDREQKLDELAMLNVKYRKLKEQNNGASENAHELLEQIARLRKELLWKVD